jgi:UDP-N-acetylglucosamine--N-acetylmuramyl-(pentapeptide) pyrophosphoryl-undecaprenol N-acetylglucosamine transferase
VRIVVTGGGTGGHVYPALEVARLAQEEADLLYMGSLRGMEGGACESRGVLFQGFDAGPVYKPASIPGAIALAKLFRASLEAKKALRIAKPDIVFSTGGYSSAPVMRAAKSLGIKLAIHACDTIPGRTLRMFADYAKVVTSTFEQTKSVLGREVIRTGLPIREELRRQTEKRQPDDQFVMVLGGSGGAKFLNEMVPLAAEKLTGIRFLHSAGKTQYESVKDSVAGISGYDMRPYIEATQLAGAYQTAGLVIARSGSSISEYAMARIPSILIPLPSSADDHQFHNAKEFASIGGSTVMTQGVRNGEREANAESLAQEIQNWLENAPRREAAMKALAEWDRPDATIQIWQAIVGATRT